MEDPDAVGAIRPARRGPASSSAIVLGLPVALGAGCAPAAGRPFNPRLASLPAARWVEIHRQQATDPVRFHRQWHGGSAFDTRRGRIVLFGSDTHGDDWTHSPLFFDLASPTWTRAYPDDPPSTHDLLLLVAGEPTAIWALKLV